MTVSAVGKERDMTEYIAFVLNGVQLCRGKVMPVIYDLQSESIRLFLVVRYKIAYKRYV